MQLFFYQTDEQNLIITLATVKKQLHLTGITVTYNNGLNLAG